MMQILTLIPKIAFFPFWMLWKAYVGLWWAFDDEPAAKPVKKDEVGQDRAFQAVDSRPAPRPKPLTALRLGFAASIVGSLMMGVVTAIAAEAGGMSSRGAGFAWIWATAALFVGSVWGIARSRKRRRAADGPRRFWKKRAPARTVTPPGPAASVASAPPPPKNAGTTPNSGTGARAAWVVRCDKARAAALTAGALAAGGCRNAGKACRAAYKVAKPGARYAWGRLADAWRSEAAKRQVSRG